MRSASFTRYLILFVSLIRVDLTTGMRTTIAGQGFLELQGLLVDAYGDIFVSDDAANLIEEFLPISHIPQFVTKVF